jgi:hypothetical protein
MARIRTVKPEFWTDDKVVSVSRDARLFFVGMFNWADDEGILEDKPLQLKMRIFPSDSDLGETEINALLGQLADKKLIQRYVVKSQRLICISKFNRHQKIDHPSQSRFPGPQSEENPNDREKIRAFAKKSPGREGKGRDQGREGKGKGKGVVREEAPYQELLNLWNEHRPKGLPGAKGLNDKRRQYMKAGWAGFPDMEHWRKVIKNQAANPHRMGSNDRGWKANIDFVFREWLRMAEELPEFIAPTVPSGFVPRGAVIPPGKPDCPDCGGKGFLVAERMGLNIRRQCPCTEKT